MLGEGCERIFASLALMAEALAVLFSLLWALENGHQAVEVCSDSLLLVR